MIINKKGFVKARNGAKDIHEFIKLAFEGLNEHEVKHGRKKKKEFDCILIPQAHYDELIRIRKFMNHLIQAA